MKRIAKAIANSLGYTVSKKPKQNNTENAQNGATADPTLYADISEESKRIYEACIPYTLLSLERIDSIVTAIDYLCKNNIPGDIVECGVWRGGAMYAAAQALAARKSFNRKIFLFDAFEVDAMFSTPNESQHDKSYADKTVAEMVSTGVYKKDDYNYQIEDVRSLLTSAGLPAENIVFKVGRIENTLPCNDIDQIALLRLDTDWYESTKHELIHLYPKLIKGGVLLIDDYGHWKGCRQAVDEYIGEEKLQILLHRTDYTGRSAIKY